MALIPPVYLNSIVALGRPSGNGEVSFSATGFLYGRLVHDADTPEAKRYRVYLVTNRHVFEGLDQLIVRFNGPIGEPSRTYGLILREADGTTPWTVHPNPDHDVAVTPIDMGRLERDGMQFLFLHDDLNVIARERANTEGVSEGDGVFVLGFPLGEAGEERNYAIVRHGIVARIQDWLSGAAEKFLIDASIFPGNSGGPVFTRPEAIAITGTTTTTRCDLIGMVSGYLPYQEIAVSQQTGRPRLVLEENSGLALVVPTDVIQEAIEVAYERQLEEGAPLDLDDDELASPEPEL